MSNSDRTISQIQSHVWTQLDVGKISYNHPNYANRLIGEAWRAGATRAQLDELCANDNEKLDVYGLSARLAGNTHRRRSWRKILIDLDKLTHLFVENSGGPEWLNAPLCPLNNGLSSNLQVTALFVGLVAKGIVTLIGQSEITDICQGMIYAYSKEPSHFIRASIWMQSLKPDEREKLGKLLDTIPIVDIMQSAFEETNAMSDEAHH